MSDEIQPVDPWTAALADEAFVESVRRGQADIDAGRVHRWAEIKAGRCGARLGPGTWCPEPAGHLDHWSSTTAEPVPVEFVAADVRATIRSGRRAYEAGRTYRAHQDAESRRWALVLGLVGFLLILAVVAALATPRPEPAISPSPTQAGAPLGGNGPAGAPIAAAAVVGGLATYYDAPSSSDAAAGPGLRAFLGSGWRGSWVTVHAGGRSVRVQLTDWCACGDRHGQPTLIDLDDRAFARLASLSRGVVPVAIEASSSSPTLPPTDTEETR